MSETKHRRGPKVHSEKKKNGYVLILTPRINYAFVKFPMNLSRNTMFQTIRDLVENKMSLLPHRIKMAIDNIWAYTYDDDCNLPDNFFGSVFVDLVGFRSRGLPVFGTSIRGPIVIVAEEDCPLTDSQVIELNEIIKKTKSELLISE